MKIVYWLIGSLLMVFLVLSWVFAWFSAYMMLSPIILLFGASLSFGIASVLEKRFERAELDKKSFEYAWKRINEILRSMGDYRSIRWRGGEDVRAGIQTFNVSGRYKDYLAVKGDTVKDASTVVAIFCITDDNLVYWNDNPNPKQRQNPFDDFSPMNDHRRHLPDGYGSKDKRVVHEMRRGSPTAASDDLVDSLFYDKDGEEDYSR